MIIFFVKKFAESVAFGVSIFTKKSGGKYIDVDGGMISTSMICNKYVDRYSSMKNR